MQKHGRINEEFSKLYSKEWLPLWYKVTREVFADFWSTTSDKIYSAHA